MASHLHFCPFCKQNLVCVREAHECQKEKHDFVVCKRCFRLDLFFSLVFTAALLVLVGATAWLIRGLSNIFDF